MTRPVFYLSPVLFFLSISVASGQTRSELREKFFEAEAYVLYEEWQEALPGYRELLQLFPENYNYKYRIGMCYLNIPGQKELALGYLQDAVQNINPKYKEGRFGEKGAPSDAIYYLANAYQITNQLDKAIETFEHFYNSMDREKYDTNVVKFQIESCQNAKNLMDVPVFTKEANLGDNINDRFSAFNPVVSADESIMVFSKKLQFYTAPYFTRKINGEWAPAVPLIEQLLVDEGISTGLSADGTELYLYKSDNYDGNIYVSNYVDGRWTPAVRLNDNINTNFWESHASVSADGKTLYFTSNRKGGYGGLDIYYSKRDSTGNWGPAVNMGPVINTRYNEETPFLDRSNKTLFFSSRGHFSMGGHDIFYSTINDNGEWSVPVNLGFPVNTTDDDIFYSPVGDGYIAYRSKYDDEGYGEQDIFRLEVFNESHPRKFYIRGLARIRDLNKNFIDSVMITALDKEEMDTILIVYSDPLSGKYEFEIQNGEYDILYESNGTERKAEELKLPISHRGDSVLMPDKVLGKSDFTAMLELIGIDNSKKFKAGDTIMIELAIEPSSILVTDHTVAGKPVSSEEFIVYNDRFSYPMVARTGNNRVEFTSTDRFNNMAQRYININIPAEVITPSRPVAPVTTAPAVKPAETKRVTEQVVEITDPSIDSMKMAISRATGDDPAMQDAIIKISAKSIRNAGEWLGTLYSVAIEDGTDKEIMLRLIASMTADYKMSSVEYLESLEKYTSGNLKDFIRLTLEDPPYMETPEDVINYLVESADKGGYTTQELFEALARMIAIENKSADDIMHYFNKVEGNNLWILWILLGATALTLFIIVSRRRKKKDNNG